MVVRVTSIGLVLVLFGAAACSLLTDFDGLAGDGQVPSSDAGSDWRPDATTVDSPAPVEASVDATLEGGVTTWCPATHPGAKYCADYDDGRPLSALGVVSGNIVIAAGIGEEGTNGLRVTTPQTSTYTVATIGTPIVSGGTAFDLDFVARVENAGTAPYTEIFHLVIRIGANKMVITFALNENLTVAEQFDSTVQRTIIEKPLDATKPRSIRSRITTSPAPWHLAVDVDGARVVDETLQKAPAQPGQDAQLEYGIAYSGPSTSKSIVIDNVFLDAHD